MPKALNVYCRLNAACNVQAGDRMQLTLLSNNNQANHSTETEGAIKHSARIDDDDDDGSLSALVMLVLYVVLRTGATAENHCAENLP